MELTDENIINSTPMMQELLAELGRTSVISDVFKDVLLTKSLAAAKDCYERGVTEGKQSVMVGTINVVQPTSNS